jgi:pimeloyl-ACP methyl ester carboxylesterase
MLDLSSLEPAPALYPVPGSVQLDCGYLKVPESRKFADGSSLRLYVAVVRSRSPKPRPDPIIWLNGGPGEHSGEAIQLMGGKVGDHLLAERDLIVFDQRGAGKSVPSLLCPELDQCRIRIATTNPPADERSRLYLESALRARDRFVAQGVDLSAFNTVENAADVNDLRRALGLECVNLYGQSYGTRLALATMRDHTEGIRSVILDSVLPIQVDIYADAVTHAARSFELLFRACRADPGADRAYPRLRQVFHDLVARLNASPEKLPTTDPCTGEPLEVCLTGEVFIGILFVSLFQNSAVAELPRLIYQAHHREYAVLAERIGSLLKGYSEIGWGLQHSVFSTDQPIGTATRDAIAAAAGRHPEIGPMSSWVTPWLSDHIVPLAELWGARPEVPPHPEPVFSSLPTLVLAGEYDQSTPAAWGRQACETLSNSLYFEFPGRTHGVITGGPCVLEIIDQFLSDPFAEPDSDCLSEMGPPSFHLP